MMIPKGEDEVFVTFLESKSLRQMQHGNIEDDTALNKQNTVA